MAALHLLRASLSFAALALVLAASGSLPTGPPAAAQGPITIGVDANPAGNGATSLAEIDACISVTRSADFDVDIFIQNVTELLAWEVFLEYDPAIILVTGSDVTMFQGANEGSRVIDVSADVPDSSGLYQAAAADTADPPTPDSGSGVLARLTLRSLAPGMSNLRLVALDVVGDERLDLGPTLVAIDGEPIDDSNGDTFFDGPMESAQIFVDSPCPGETPSPAPEGQTPTPTPPFDVAARSDNDANTGLIVGAIAGGAAALLAAGFAAVFIIRRRTSS